MTPLLWSVRVPTWLVILWRNYVARERRTGNQANDPRSIVLFRLDQLGDVVLTTPVFRELKRLYPRARCTVVVRPQHKAILTTNRNIDEVLAPPEPKVRWLPARAQWLISVLWFYWTELRHRQFDLALSPRWDVDESLATLLCVLTTAGMRVAHSARVSADKRRLNRGFDAAFDVVAPAGSLQHEVHRNLAVVEALGGRVGSTQLEIPLTDNDRKFARELFTHHDQRRVLVALGIGGRAPGRKWPLARYAESVRQLNERLPVQPVIVCSEEEDAEASQLSRMLEVPPYILSGVQLREVCAVLHECELFIGNDTGTAHLAAAMNCPTVVVSRHPANGDRNHANSPSRFAPLSPRSRVLQPVSGAGGCMTSCRSKEAHCILQVTAEKVVAAALELLPREKLKSPVWMLPNGLGTNSALSKQALQSIGTAPS
jgi:heptosyltransferase-2